MKRLLKKRFLIPAAIVLFGILAYWGWYVATDQALRAAITELQAEVDATKEEFPELASPEAYLEWRLTGRKGRVATNGWKHAVAAMAQVEGIRDATPFDWSEPKRLLGAIADPANREHLRPFLDASEDFAREIQLAGKAQMIVAPFTARESGPWQPGNSVTPELVRCAMARVLALQILDGIEPSLLEFRRLCRLVSMVNASVSAFSAEEMIDCYNELAFCLIESDAWGELILHNATLARMWVLRPLYVDFANVCEGELASTLPLFASYSSVDEVLAAAEKFDWPLDPEETIRGLTEHIRVQREIVRMFWGKESGWYTIDRINEVAALIEEHGDWDTTWYLKTAEEIFATSARWFGVKLRLSKVRGRALSRDGIQDWATRRGPFIIKWSADDLEIWLDYEGSGEGNLYANKPVITLAPHKRD